MLRRRFLAAAGAALVPAPLAARTRPAAPAIDVAAHNAELIARLRAPGAPLRAWRRIAVHHTAGEYATLAGIDRELGPSGE